MAAPTTPHPAPAESGGPGRGPAAPARAGAPRRAATPAEAWEALPNGALVARVKGYRLVVRPVAGGRFRFALLKQLPGNGGLAHVASGGRGGREQAMLAAERAVAALPGHGKDSCLKFTQPRVHEGLD